MFITQTSFGKTSDGKDAELFTISNKNGVQAKITNYGGILVSLLVPDKNQNLVDVVLGYDNIEKYYNNSVYLGALIGRCANRIGNGNFFIDGKEYNVALNDGKNHLHGGNNGFNSKLWNTEITDKGLNLSYFSPDGEENYPGNLNVSVIYALTDDNELVLEYKAVSDKTTVINLTNHSYFNLNGHNSGTILDQELWLNSINFTPADEGSIPTGEILSVKGTPMDFTIPMTIGARIDDNYEQLNFAGGYDHNWEINHKSNGLEKAASLYSSKTGIFMEVSTTLPGIQIYAGNYLANAVDKLGKENAVYDKRSGICFESQYFPNAVNIPNFKSCVFKAGETFNHTTVFKFSTK